MSIKRIIQLVAGYSNGDAISNEARTLRTIFQSWGYESLIVCDKEHILPLLAKDCVPLESYRTTALNTDVLLLHFSIGSVVNDVFPLLPGRKALLYHNITPAHYFQAVNSQIQRELLWGRKQLLLLRKTAELIMADSAFNARELTEAGYKSPTVFPLVIDWESLSNSSTTNQQNNWNDGLKNILFVGRCAPNKKIEDVLFAFSYYQQYVEPASRLICVGSFAGTEKYFGMLQLIKRNFHMHHVELCGALPQAALNAAYQAADLFLCMSEHEGFCIPLLEAMAHGVPVLAYKAGAIQETMGDAGVIFNSKRFDIVAEMMRELTTSPLLRAAIINQQSDRIKHYTNRDLATEIKQHLAPLLQGHLSP